LLVLVEETGRNHERLALGAGLEARDGNVPSLLALGFGDSAPTWTTVALR